MNGKDLLAVLAMVVPGFLLIALIAFTLVPSADVMTALPDAEFVHAGAGAEKINEGRDASMHARPQIATQKLMRDPWEKPIYAKSSRAPEPAPCDSIVGGQKVTCFYW